MKLKFIILFLTFTNLVFSQKLKNITLGNWHAELALNDRLFLPFNLEFSKVKKFKICICRKTLEVVEIQIYDVQDRRRGFYQLSLAASLYIYFKEVIIYKSLFNIIFPFNNIIYIQCFIMLL